MKILVTLLLAATAFGKDYLVMPRSANHIMSEYKHIGSFPRPTYKLSQDELKSLLQNSLASDFIIDENFEISIFSEPTDEHYELQWAFSNEGNNEPRRGGGRIPIPGVVGVDMDMDSMWDEIASLDSIKVAVVDTGVDYKHPDLKEHIAVNLKELNGKKNFDDDGNGFIDDVYGYNFSSDKADPMDDNKHGTHVAGIIGAIHNQIGVAGIMKNVEILPVKFMDKKGRGDLEKGLKALNYAVENGAMVVNNSWGAMKESLIMKEFMINAGKEKGVVFVAAAGNSYKDIDVSPLYPASFGIENQITVAAYSPEDRMTGFSCWGPTKVHTAAPGRNIISTVPGGKYEVLSGTSMSAPYVTGAIALLKSKYPKMSAKEIQDKVVNSSILMDHFRGKTLSEGRLSLRKLLE
ncbi:S8 family peptidase [Bacteriovorax sp. Seq25_V]|uniref:S8 family peptidase n=1 Tax=Bacteriovorax sp. Seq25_V TaxID=1201288 RepID=UPI00038A53D8|nr:S8 family peptidase [Bacteriovorax sp. Seq25_V]EQC47265.1 peptidase, S8/S53 family [Bacteriovorax sp. Seq25_V]